MQANVPPLEDLTTIRSRHVDEDRYRRSTTRPAPPHLRDEVARLEQARESLRREIAELVRVRDELRAATEPGHGVEPVATPAPPTVQAPLRELRLSLDLPSDDGEMAAAFERFFDTEFEHDKSRDWILSDLDQRTA